MLTAGAKLGPYEITAPLGAGGMGEVYRAKDTRLGREVAIKILSDDVSTNRNRMDRFAQEARAASALNHPNIITVYDVGGDGAASYIAMELIDGKSLRELLHAGPLPAKKLITIASQIADGLAKAHEAGIVHRDLKPENIMITKDGYAKILDFGLAKATEPTPDHSVSALSTAMHTSEGTVLGTVGYMSPEQAAAKTVDFHSDQFSLGSILYEMVTGKRAFARNTAVQSLSAIIQDEPEPLQALSPQTPAPMRWIIDRCLAKDPAERYASTRDLARELQSVRDHFSDLTSSTEAIQQAVVAPRSRHLMKVLPWALLLAVSALFAAWIARENDRPVAAATRRLEISIPRGYQLDPNASLAMSPDGSKIVFGLLDHQMQTKLWLRSLDKFEAQPIAGTDSASLPFWSPDSKSIAFFVESNSTLRRLDLATGIEQVLCKTAGSARGGSWGSNGIILFSPGTNTPIQQVPATGGAPKDVTKVDPAILDGSHRFPVFLPDGEHFLFTLWSNHMETAARVGGIYAGTLSTGEIRKLSSDASQAVLAGKDRLLLYRNEALQAVAFDAEKLEMNGSIEEINRQPLYLPASGALGASASSAGEVAYAVSSGEGTALLAWVDSNSGAQKMIGQDRLGIQNLAMAPDGKHFAAQVVTRSGSEIWVADADRVVMTRLTRGGFDATGPVWSPDGKFVAFSSSASGSQAVYLQPADASKAPELFFTQTDHDFGVRSWSNDGHSMLLESELKASTGRSEIWLLDVATRKASPLLSDPSASLGGPVISPDGRWLAYISDESGDYQVYVRPYPALDRRWQISREKVLTQSSFFALAATTYLPHWRSDGRELLYITVSGSIQAAGIEAQGENLSVAAPYVILKPTFPLLAIAPTPDHSRFLAAIVPGDVTSEPIRLVLGASTR